MPTNDGTFLANTILIVMTMDTQHIPVLRNEVLGFLKPKSDGIYVDATVGLGGHSASILEKSSPNSRVIGIDLDGDALEIARVRLHTFTDRYLLIQGNFARMVTLLRNCSIDAVDGILLDLGVSSLQLDTPSRGFSFSHKGLLDMRMDPRQALLAVQVVNDSAIDTLIDIFKRYGEERFARQIAYRIVAARQQEPITTTTRLAEIVKAAIPRKASSIHPARRVFQALRIYVNAELENLDTGLDAAISLLKPGGCLCVITFHSLEDRIVKRRFQRCARACICPPKTPLCICEHEPSLQILTKRPVLPAADEVQDNRRARSAKLRAARKIASEGKK